MNHFKGVIRMLTVTYFELVLFTRPDGGNQRAREESLRDPSVHMIAREDFFDFIDALYGEKLVAAIINNGQRAVE